MNERDLQDVARLNEAHGIAREAEFVEGGGGLPVLKIRNAHGEADVYLHGGHITHYRPVDAKPVLWLSPETPFGPDTAIRGGIPVCFPWFGPHATDASLPAHGFARVSPWSVESLQTGDGDETSVVLALDSSDDTLRQFPHAFEARLRVVVGATLEVSLTTRNVSGAPFTFGDALHTYFSVSDIARVSVRGLEGASYLDRVGPARRGVLDDEAIRCAGEYDRTFVDTMATCELLDEGWQRTIVVAKEGSRSTVVWNPWIEKAARLSGFPADGWKRMLCIETANADGCEVTLAPGEAHTTRATIAVKPA